VSKKLEGDYLADGWELDKYLKYKAKFRRPKSVDEILENQVWRLMYLLGYHELNKGRQFTVAVKRPGAEALQKQVDVFAKDDETVIVGECKASRRIKIIWMFCTRNIIWSKPDKDRAAGLKIHIVTERQLGYYLQIADHLKGAARYQFLATFLEGQKIPALANKRVPAIRGNLGGKRFYCFVTTPRDLLKIAFINHRSLDHPDGAPSYQRLVSRTRMKQIKMFLEKGGFFPTNLLLNLNTSARFDITASDKESGVTYGHLYDLFVTINHEQITVPKNLLTDLKGELKWGSKIPSERIAAVSARLVRLLDQDIGEPFHGRVTRQGITATEDVCLTMPALVDGLRHSGLIGRSALNNKEFQPGPLCGTTDKETLDRARIAINAFFNNVRANRSKRWEAGRPGHLCTNTAIQGYLRLFASLIAYMEANKGIEPPRLFRRVFYLSPVTMTGASCL
jgi:hypothetical protein